MSGVRAALVLNSAARGDAAAIADGAARVLGRAGLEVALVGSASEALQQGADLLVGVGGDGTARAIAQAMAESLGTWPGGGPAPGAAPRLLILPGGTGNSVHRALWGDRSWQDTLRDGLDAAAARRDLDLMSVEGHDRGVLLGASAGLLRWTVEATTRFPDLRGRELYASAGLAAATELRPFAGRVSVDGAPLVEGPLALAAVAGARRRGGSLTLFPDAVLDDGRLDVCVLSATTSQEAIAQLIAAMEGRHPGMPGVHTARGGTVTLEALDGPLPFEHDGDLWPGEDTALTLRVVPAAVPVVSPPSWDE